MINIGIGIGWAKAIYSVANNIIANFKARVATYPGSIFEAGPCLDTTLEKLNAIGLLDNASLVITPNAYNETKLYSVVPNTTLGDMDVVRATTATRVNELGLIEVVPKNLLTYSNSFIGGTGWSTAGSTVTRTPNFGISPDGTQNSTRIQFSTSGLNFFKSITASNASASIYVKGTAGQTINFYIGSTDQLFTLNGQWQRIERFAISVTQVSLSTFNSATARDIEIYGAQLEVGSTATTYFPTTTRLNIPRIDYTNGTCPSLLVEPQRTNVTLRSDDFGNAYWSKFNTTITTNNTTAPDGAITADKIVENTVNSFHSMDSTFSSGTGIYTASIYAKVGERRYLRLNITEITPAIDHTALFDLQTGTLLSSGTGVTASIINAGNGWYRIILTSPALVGGQVRMAVLMQTTTSSTPQQYLGDGTSGLYLWGAQLEVGSYASSYIPTVASSVTRNADVISKTGISSLIGQTEGTLYAEINFTNVGTEKYILNINSSGSDTIAIRRLSGGAIRCVFTAAISSGTTNQSSAILPNGNYKLAYKYISGSLKLFINGVLSFSLTPTFTFGSALDYLRIGQDGGNTLQLGDSLKSIQLYKTALTDAECIALTTL